MKKVVVIGASNIDYLAHSFTDIVMSDSNPGYIYKSWGGVGRNIAESLARLGIKPTLLTALGDDAEDFIMMAKSIQLNLIYQRVAQTPSYLAIHDKFGNLVSAVAAMETVKKLNPAFLRKHHELIYTADILVIDANLSDETLSYIFKNYALPIYVDLVSSAKAVKFMPYLSKIHTIKINPLEGKALTAFDDPLQIGQVLLNKGIQNIYLTLGKEGSYHFTADQTDFYHKILDHKIVNDTGAGDAFYAGTIFAELLGINPLKTGTILSHLTLQSKDSVYKSIRSSQLIAMVKE